MVFSVNELLEWPTMSVTLLPGDLVVTWTPHGTGGFQQPPRYLADGDAWRLDRRDRLAQQRCPC
jgi:2-keto-4-pentenoate hydratase/2-oxohepta-3-ene-1,7-dioic acid hydratase in catechol pathway